MNIQSALFEDTNDVVTAYADGFLQVTVSARLDRQQVKQFIMGAQRIAGVKAIEVDNLAQYASGYTAFAVTFNPKYAQRLDTVRAALKDYAAQFLTQTTPAAQQASMF